MSETERSGKQAGQALDGKASARGGRALVLMLPPGSRLFLATQYVDGRKGRRIVSAGALALRSRSALRHIVCFLLQARRSRACPVDDELQRLDLGLVRLLGRHLFG
jgi:hypothetical protein